MRACNPGDRKGGPRGRLFYLDRELNHQMTEGRMLLPYMKLFSLVIYVVLQVLCLPLLIVGVLLAGLSADGGQ